MISNVVYVTSLTLAIECRFLLADASKRMLYCASSMEIYNFEEVCMNTGAESRFGLSAFALKIIAIVTMTCNHIAHGFENQLPLFLLVPLYIVGGLTFPIMAYLMIEGYQKTSNVKKYMLRLLIFGLIAIFPFILVFKALVLNVLFTFLFGLICLYLRDKIKKKALFWLCFAGFVLITLFCDWAFVGVAMIVLFGIIKDKKRRIIITTVVCAVALSLMEFIFGDGWGLKLMLDFGFSFFVLCSMPFLWAYNGKKGYSPRSLRYLFYIFYPAHLLVIGGIMWLTQVYLVP